jgi:hypothetical protein
MFLILISQISQIIVEESLQEKIERQDYFENFYELNFMWNFTDIFDNENCSLKSLDCDFLLHVWEFLVGN